MAGCRYSFELQDEPAHLDRGNYNNNHSASPDRRQHAPQQEQDSFHHSNSSATTTTTPTPPPPPPPLHSSPSDQQLSTLPSPSSHLDTTESAQLRPQQPSHSKEREVAAATATAGRPLIADHETSSSSSTSSSIPRPTPHLDASSTAPIPPPHRDTTTRWQQRTPQQTISAYSNVTTDADNFSEQAAGGLTGVAMSVADQNARESGIEAMQQTPTRRPLPSYDTPPPQQYGRAPPPAHQPYYDESQFRRGSPAQQSQQQQPQQWDDSPYQYHGQPYYEDSPYSRPMPRQDMSSSSLTPLGAAAFPPGSATPSSRSTTSRSQYNYHDPYAENSYRYSRNLDPSLSAGIDPNMIADDGDDGLDYRIQHRGSLLSMGNSSDRNVAAGGAAAGGMLGAWNGLKGRSTPTSTSPSYDPVGAFSGAGSTSPAKEYDLATGQEKTAYLKKQQARRKRRAILVGVIVAIVVLGAILGGTIGSKLSAKNPDAITKPSGASAAEDNSTNGDLNKNSAEIKKLMNNKDLHKVFPGIDYTPMYTQYPDCQKYPASQNNVTRDIAVISQLTNIVRLYGTDCNATQMVIHAIDQLGLKGKMKIWMGVWQDKDLVTNARQLKIMYDIFDQYGADHFLGIILGNEVLFRKDFTITSLGTLISDLKTNLTARGITLPVASSDLGDDWTQALADEVDYVMANIHPFFAGVSAADAAGWTWRFWQENNVPLKADLSKHIISETGWPSTGGRSCGAAPTCAVGSVAGIDEMNQFLENWVCPALKNGTNYFMFEAFDEPWKIKFNEPGKEWEDKWGIMDVNRNLKPGLKIPDCGGLTVDGKSWM